MFIKLFSKVFENIKTWLTFSTDEHFPRSFRFIIKTIVLNMLEEIFKAKKKMGIKLRLWLLKNRTDTLDCFSYDIRTAELVVVSLV